VKELSPWPAYIQERLDLWDKLKKESDEQLAAKKPEPIEVMQPCHVLLDCNYSLKLKCQELLYLVQIDIKYKSLII